MQRIETRVNGPYVFGGCVLFMREFLPELRREEKALIRGNAVEPLRGEIRAQRIVKRRVDLDGVEKFGEVGGFVKAARTRRGVEDAVPIGVRPSRGTNQDAS